MAWFENSYRCEACGKSWEDEWSCACDSECPTCGKAYTPYASYDLTFEITYDEHGVFQLWKSADDADDKPKYSMIGEFKFYVDAQAKARELGWGG